MRVLSRGPRQVALLFRTSAFFSPPEGLKLNSLRTPLALPFQGISCCCRIKFSILVRIWALSQACALGKVTARILKAKQITVFISHVPST